MTIYAVSISFILIPMALPIIPFLLFGTVELTTNYWFPFDPFLVETYLFAYLWINWMSWYGLFIFLGTEALLYGLITALSLEFDILKADLMGMSFVIENERGEKLKILIDRHNKLMQVRDKLQGIYSITFLTSFVESSIVLCFIVFQLSATDNNLNTYLYYVPYLCIASAQTLLLCFFGQKLMDCGESVAEGIYNCGWEDFKDNTLKKHLILVILRSQQFKRLNAMGFADISLESFTAVS